MTSKLKIETLDDISHILKRPDMYVGSIRNKRAEEYVADFNQSEDGTLNLAVKKETITFSPAILRIFVEALSNAIDNVQRSKDAGVPCTKIKVAINKETGETSIWNDGLVIPIEHNDGTTEYKHTMIFGKLRTSTNFNDDEERTVSGRNGLGIKLTNVFSKSFKIKAVDPQNGKCLTQEWNDNMTKANKPKITASSLKNGYTEVTWTPDFNHFGMPGYSEDIIRLYTRYVFDAAMLTSVNVYLNDTKLPIKSLQDYSKLFSSPTTESVYIRGKDSEVLLTTSTEFEAVSFVNGVFTMHGGKHVDGWSEAIFRPIVEHFNKPNKPQITIKDVKQFYRLFVVSTLVNPEFSSQSKTELTSPEVQAAVEKKTISAILKWTVTSQISDIIKSKELLVMKKSESKKKYVAIEGYMPANEAGGKNSAECTLALCEGLSAKSFVVKGMDSPNLGKNGRDWFGVYPLRGKILNVRSANGKQIADNKEITAVIQALGLKYGLDYRLDDNFATLNYGKLLILTDADTDGKHIAGLILNFFHFLFPTLLERETPFVQNMLTPIAKFSMKSEERVFYDLYKADEYYKENKDRNIRVKYYKGLGTHSDDEISQEFGKQIISIVKDEKADDAILKAFDKKNADLRKMWIGDHDPSIHTEINENTPERLISVFIDEDLITHSIDNCLRSIPCVVDSLKQSQRKILYAAFLKNLKKNFKVAQFAGYVAENTNYHHGEQNLQDTIINMAQHFVNSNNIPLFARDGQFGSRLSNGADAAQARYIFTRLDTITRKIFREDDDVLLERVIDDGDIVEPKFYVPIIPMILVNGCLGIGTGWATSIPMYNPLDVINCVREWIEEPPSIQDGILFSGISNITPWYRGFKGKIEDDGAGKFTTYGVVNREDKKKNPSVTITEIPIGMSIEDCRELLNKVTYEDKIIKSFKDYSGADTPNFELKELSDGMKCGVKNLKLFSKIATTNMVLFDRNGKIKKYENVVEIIDEFCQVRMEYYIKRKKYLLESLFKRIEMMKNKHRFLTEVMDGGLSLYRRKEENVIKDLEDRGYMKEMTKDSDDNDVDKGYNYLLRMHVRSYTDEKLIELEADIKKHEDEFATLEKTAEKDIWLKELDELEKDYNTWLTEISKEQSKTKKKK